MCFKIISYNAIMHAHNVIHWILIQFLKKEFNFCFVTSRDSIHSCCST